jgi:hypothetical protein
VGSQPPLVDRLEVVAGDEGDRDLPLVPQAGRGTLKIFVKILCNSLIYIYFRINLYGVFTQSSRLCRTTSESVVRHNFHR